MGVSARAHGAIKRAVWVPMPAAYAQASVDGTLSAYARQVMYAVRRINGLGDDLSSDYFLKKLLDDYLDDPATDSEHWDIVRDDRGSFTEPHTEREVPLGTIAVRDYQRDVRRFDPVDDGGLIVPQFALTIPTVGPKARFGHVLFIEKEGFDLLIDRARIAQRFDLAIASCKGYSVKAARRLIRWLHRRFDVPVLVVHDFDKQGIGIFDTLGDGDYTDLGLRLDDLADDRWNLGDELASEAVSYGKADPRPNLRRRGASEEEIEHLCSDGTGTDDDPFRGRRVELNALVGTDFTDWLEAKLNEHGVEKVVPGEDVIEAAYRRAYEREVLNVAIRQAHDGDRQRAAAVELPDDIVTQVTDGIDNDPERAWDDVLAAFVEDAVNSQTD
jgi:hypothetical protein